MSNHTTGAQRTNARQDKIWEACKQAQRKGNIMNENERDMAVLKGHLPQHTTGWQSAAEAHVAKYGRHAASKELDVLLDSETSELSKTKRELAEARASVAELLAALKALVSAAQKQRYAFGCVSGQVVAAIARAEKGSQ